MEQVLRRNVHESTAICCGAIEARQVCRSHGHEGRRARAELLEAERKNIREHKVYDVDHPEEASAVARRNPNAIFIRGHVAGAIKNWELPPAQRKVKLRAVANGGDARTGYGEKFEETDLYSLPVSQESQRACGGTTATTARAATCAS